MKVDLLHSRTSGASHKRINKECQDYYDDYAFKEKNTYIIAVADGHGSSSCPYSSDGSKKATAAFLKILSELYKKFDNSDAFMTYLKREGDTKVAQAVCREWQEKVLYTHSQYKRGLSIEADGKTDYTSVYKQYGSTLLGLLITSEFLFALQIGDGDIAFINKDGFSRVIEGDKQLGVETHSLSKPDAWKKAISIVQKWQPEKEIPCAFILSTDGFANSFKSEEAYQKAAIDYYKLLNQYGPKVIKNYLKKWLYETSEQGCGDDITMYISYCYDESSVFEPEPNDEGTENGKTE